MKEYFTLVGVYVLWLPLLLFGLGILGAIGETGDLAGDGDTIALFAYLSILTTPGAFILSKWWWEKFIKNCAEQRLSPTVTSTKSSRSRMFSSNLDNDTNGRLPSIVRVTFTDDAMRVQVSDGREIAVPLAWYPRLATASRQQLDHFELAPGGYGIHWPDLNEDLSVRGFLLP